MEPKPIWRRAHAWTTLGLLALLGYGVFIGVRFGPYAGGSDSSGYYNSARLLIEGRLSTTQRTIPEWENVDRWLLTPLGFVGTEGTQRLNPSYPVGAPIHYALGGALLGWHWGPRVIGILAAVAAVWLCFLSARSLGISQPLAVSAGVALGACAVFLFISVQPMSDTLATTWVVAAIYFALKSHSTAGPRWAVACGAAFGMAVLIRPSNAVLLPAFAVLLLHWSRLWRAAMGGLPFAIALAAYQKTLYGSATVSGYGSILGAFSTSWLWPTVQNYAPWTLRMLPVSVLLVLFAFTLPWRTRMRETLGLLLCVGTLGGFYLFYSVSHEVWWCLRFVLPVFPALILLSVLAAEGMTERVRSPHRNPAKHVSAAAIIAASIGAGVYWDREMNLALLPTYERAYETAATWADENIPDNAVVACMQASGALWFYSDLRILRYDSVTDERREQVMGGLRTTDRPVFAVLFEHEEEEALKRRIPADWEKVDVIANVRIWRLRKDHQADR